MLPVDKTPLARGSVREVLALAWPVMISMLSYTVMGVADTLFVGQLGTAPLAAVGLAAACVHLGYAFSNGLLRGVRVKVAQSTGADDVAGARRFAWQGVWLALALGGLVALLAPLGPQLFEWMGASLAVRELAAAYFGVRLLGAPLLFLQLAFASWFQGRGDTRTPMVAHLLANGINVALDPVLIFGLLGAPALGIAGAAVATVVGFGAAAMYLAWHFLRDAGREQPLMRSALAEIVTVGAPIGLRDLLEVGSWVAFTSLLARVGEVHLAAHVIAIRVVSVSFLPGYAVSEAVGVLTGQAVGARRPAMAREATRSGLLLAVGIMAACALVFVATPVPLVAAFGAEQDVMVVAVQLLRIAAVFQVFDAVAMVGIGALNGAGDTRITMLIGIGCAWLVKLPAGVGLALFAGMGAAGAWWGLTLEVIAYAVLAMVRLRGSAWLEGRLEAEQLAAAK